MENKGILLCGHGSRSAETLQEFKFFANTLKARLPESEITFGFLELAKPDFSEAVNTLYNNGVRSIIAVQLFLFDGKHVDTEIPSQLKEIQSKYTDINIKILPPIGRNPLFLEMLTKSILPYFEKEKSYSVLTVGVGSSNENANIQIQTVSNNLGETLKIDDIHVSFISKQAKPSYEESIANLVSNPENDILIIPLILFNGIYYKMINAISESHWNQTKKSIQVLPCLALNEHFIDLIVNNINNTK